MRTELHVGEPFSNIKNVFLNTFVSLIFFLIIFNLNYRSNLKITDDKFNTKVTR